MNDETVLITGGSGLLGKKLSLNLIDKGYKVTWLSRKAGQFESIKIYPWDIKRGYIASEALESADYVVHLAGASVAGKRWTREYKQELLSSRLESTDLLFKEFSKRGKKLKAFIGSSAIGIYGNDRGDELLHENASQGTDFLAQLTTNWEKSEDQFNSIDTRVVKLRTGIVLSGDGGALVEMMKPIKFGFGSIPGTGKQYVSWIHIDDWCEFVAQALAKDSYSGSYNLVAPNPVRFQEIIRTISILLRRNIIVHHVPPFLLTIALGEMSKTVIGSLNVSCKKLVSSGFQFEFPELGEALKNLIKENLTFKP